MEPGQKRPNRLMGGERFRKTLQVTKKSANTYIAELCFLTCFSPQTLKGIPLESGIVNNALTLVFLSLLRATARSGAQTIDAVIPYIME